MLDREVPATIERKLACMAVAALIAGVGVLALADWTTLGWVLVAYGIMALCMAYLLAVAPIVDDPP